ncbi:MAG: hypothetical protein ACLR8Y_00025 [Alistipes indistinctus]
MTSASTISGAASTWPHGPETFVSSTSRPDNRYRLFVDGTPHGCWGSARNDLAAGITQTVTSHRCRGATLLRYRVMERRQIWLHRAPGIVRDGL